ESNCCKKNDHNKPQPYRKRTTPWLFMFFSLFFSFFLEFFTGDWIFCFLLSSPSRSPCICRKSVFLFQLHVFGFSSLPFNFSYLTLTIVYQEMILQPFMNAND